MKNRQSVARILLLSVAFLVLCSPALAQHYEYDVQQIWSNGTYSSFTDLIKYKGTFYCAFREGRGHVFDERGKAEGKIRIIASKNGRKWHSVLLVGEDGMDYRDPKLSVTPDGRLMVSIGVSVYVDRKARAQYSYVCFSSDGRHYTKPERCLVDDDHSRRHDWIWRVTWHDGIGYAVDYFTQPEQGCWLLSTTDGIRYTKVCSFDIPDFPNEATVRFLPESGRMAVMVRRDAGNGMGYWATASSPYTQWEWHQMPLRLGGPDFLLLDENHFVACSRCLHIPGHPTTSVYTGDAATGRVSQQFVLPSAGDTSYPGMLVERNELWISYYSCHETEWPSIYLARIPMKCFK
ncbi:MAG: hypothetical protein IJ196_03505 [Prevotella sp.]|nr:hypothetical protein [Prevotella sp.]